MNRLHTTAAHALLALLYLTAAVLVYRLIVGGEMMATAPDFIMYYGLRNALTLLALAFCVGAAAITHAVLARR